MAAMDISEDNEVYKRSFKYKERLYDHLNIAYTERNSPIIFWNKYQIFIHEDLNLESPTRIIVPEFQIKQVIADSNYLACLDCTGNIHTTSLKFKNSAQKRLKSSFQPKEHGILHCVKYSTDYILSLKEDAQTYFLCLNRINADFNLEKKVVLQVEDWPVNDCSKIELIIKSFLISKEELTPIKEWFKEEIVWKEQCLLLISIDKINIFACLFSHKDYNESTELIKLYSCPTLLCDFTVIDNNGLTLIAGLTTGTVLRIPFKSILKKPEINIVHLNTALSKFITTKSKDSLIYTDGISLWRSENSYSKDNIQFSQFFTKDVKDFIKYGDQLICTTYTNIVYMFSAENKSSYLKFDEDVYCPAEKLLNSDYLLHITQEIDKNNEVIKRINEEEMYITAIALSKRQDIMDSVFQEKLVIYENYQDVENKTEIMLTEDLEEYFRSESLLLLVKLTSSTVQHALSNIFKNLLNTLTIHITILTQGKILKTTSLKLREQLKKVDILIPLSCKNITKLYVEIKLMCKVPGVLDKNRVIWVPLYKKVVILNAEHFIKVNNVKKHINLKEPLTSIDDMIQRVSENQHGDLVKITDASESTNKDILVFYVKLSENYKEALNNETYYNSHLNPERSAIIKKQMTSEEFLKSKIMITFSIGKEKVHLEMINNDFFNPLLKVSSKDGQVALDIRNFFANLVHDNLPKRQMGKEFVSNSLYTTAENLQKALKNSVNSKEILNLSEQFQKNVIGAMPI